MGPPSLTRRVRRFEQRRIGSDRIARGPRMTGRGVRPSSMRVAAADVAATLSDEDVSALHREALAWAGQNGLLMRCSGSEDDASLVHVPFSLLPAMPLPRALFDRACALATPFNRLVERVASQPEWLHATLAPAAEHDEFTRRLVAMHKDVLASGRPHAARRNLGVHRSDYLLDASASNADAPSRLLQVELNTISSSFAAHAQLAAAMHRSVPPNPPTHRYPNLPSTHPIPPNLPTPLHPPTNPASLTPTPLAPSSSVRPSVRPSVRAFPGI